MLEGCVRFLLDWLIEGPEGYLETNPSTSPEHNFITPDGRLACVSNSSTMDMAILKEVFFAIVSAAEVNLLSRPPKSFLFLNIPKFLCIYLLKIFENRFSAEMRTTLLKR